MPRMSARQGIRVALRLLWDSLAHRRAWGW